MSADGLVDHEVPTLITEHIEMDNSDQFSNTPRRRHEFVTLITDPRRTSYSYHKSCTDGDIASAANKGEQIKFRGRNFSWSLKAVTYLSYSLTQFPASCVTRTRHWRDETELMWTSLTIDREYDATHISSCVDRYPMHQVCKTLIYPDDITYKTVDINHFHSCFRDPNGYG